MPPVGMGEPSMVFTVQRKVTGDLFYHKAFYLQFYLLVLIGVTGSDHVKPEHCRADFCCQVFIPFLIPCHKTEEREEKAGNGERQFFFVFHRYAASFYEFLFVIVTRCAIINHADWMFV